MTKSQKKELDNLWRKRVKEKADERCEFCGMKGSNAHHIFTRSRMNTRWDEENGVYLCAAHHLFSSQFSAHKAPRKFFAWLIQRKGEAWLNALEQRSDMIAHSLDYNLIKLSLWKKP